MPDDKPKSPKRKEERIELRVDPELAERARQKAEKYGWSISSVIRALLSLWTDEDVISSQDVGRHAKRAKKPRKKKEE